MTIPGTCRTLSRSPLVSTPSTFADDVTVGVLEKPCVESVGGDVCHVLEGYALLPKPLRVDLHLQHLERSPQIGTLATPGTRNSRARIVQ